MRALPLRNRWVQVLLAALVVGVWGAVAYRVGSALPERPFVPPQQPPHTTPVSAPTDSSSLQVPSSLALNRDPFSPQWPGAEEADLPRAEPLSAAPATSETQDPPPAPALVLTGVIGETAILEAADGTIHLSRTGDRIGEVQIRGIQVDRVELGSGPHRFTLSLDR